MKIDINRVHDVLEKMSRGESLSRQCGRTTAMLVVALQLIDFERDIKIYIYTESIDHAGWMAEYAEQIAKALGFESVIHRHSRLLIINGVDVEFLSERTVKQNRRGLHRKYTREFFDHYVSAADIQQWLKRTPNVPCLV